MFGGLASVLLAVVLAELGGGGRLLFLFAVRCDRDEEPNAFSLACVIFSKW